MSKNQYVHKGLNGVLVDETTISEVDGDNARLTYRGHGIEELVNWDYMDVVRLLLDGKAGDPAGAEELRQSLHDSSVLTPAELDLIGKIDASMHPLKVLQGMAPLLDLPPPEAQGTVRRRGLALAAKLPSVLAAFQAQRMGRRFQPMNHGADPHENFLHSFFRKAPSPDQLRLFNIAQILQMEHSFNASTFAVRISASTLAPVECAVSTGFGTLIGALHGGADQKTLEMAQSIQDPGNAAAYVKDRLSSGGKIMGIGHREYRRMDPRASILKPLADAATRGTPFATLYRVLEAVETAVLTETSAKGRPLYPNVDFYKGVLYNWIGFPPDIFTALFGISRVFGYLAHYEEVCVHPVLIRPQALYVGEKLPS